MKVEVINITTENIHEIINDTNCYMIKRFRPRENCFHKAGECEMTPAMKATLADLFADNTIVVRITA